MGFLQAELIIIIFTSYKLDTELLENKNNFIYPKVNYSLTNFPYNENFEGTGSSLKVISDSLNHSLKKFMIVQIINLVIIMLKVKFQVNSVNFLNVIPTILIYLKIKLYI